MNISEVHISEMHTCTRLVGSELHGNVNACPGEGSSARVAPALAGQLQLDDYHAWRQ